MDRQRPSAAFFDLDKTIIATSSALAFVRPFYDGGLLTRRAMAHTAYAHLFFLSVGADHRQMERMRAQLSRMVTGWDVQYVREIVAERLADVIGPQVYAEAAALITEHRQAGRDVIIVSASGSDVVEPIGVMLGADQVVATRMQTDEGRYTGAIDFYAFGPHKAEAVRSLAEQRGYDLAECYAYSDSITDIPMLATVGHPVAVNPDRHLRREAEHRQWPVLDFPKPHRSDPLDEPQIATARVPTLPVGAAVGGPPLVENGTSGRTMAAALSAGAATAGLVWYTARHWPRPADH